MKRVVVCVLVLGFALAAMAVPALGAPVTDVRDAVDFNCVTLSTSGGTAFLQISTRPDGGVFTTIWHPGDSPEDEPWLTGNSQDVVFAGSTLQATVPLFDLDNGVEYGNGVVDAVVTAAGEPQTFTSRSGQGNTRSRSTTTITPGAATGTYTVAGVGTFDLSACSVELLHIESFRTNPAAYVENLAPHLEIVCEFAGATGSVFLYAEGFMPGDRGSVETSVWHVPDGSEEPNLGGGGLATLTRSTFDAAIDLYDAVGEPLGVAVVDAQFVVVDRARTVLRDGAATYTVRSEFLGLAGTLTMPDGQHFPLDTCGGAREYGQQRLRPAA